MPELDPKSLELNQDIEVRMSDCESYITRTFVGFRGGLVPWITHSQKHGTEFWRDARLPQPKRPDVVPFKMVGLSGGGMGVCFGFDEYGNPLVARLESFSRAKIDGQWYPPEENRTNDGCDCEKQTCQCKQED